MYNFQEDERVQYDENDTMRIEKVAASLTSDAMDLIIQLGVYRDELAAPVDEDSALRMRECRQALIASLAFLQETTGRIAHVVRVDSEALEERLATVNEREELDTSGL